MLEHKAFVGVTTYSDNSANTVAPVGELSKLSRSFSRDIKLYPNPDNQTILLNLFASHDDSSSDYLEPSVEVMAEMQKIAKWVIAQGDLALAPTDLPSYIDSLTGHFVDMTGAFNVGELRTYGDGSYASSVGYVTETYSWKLWFADDSFQAQYDEYHVETVFPVDDIDDLHREYPHVQGLLEKATSTVMLDKIRQIEIDFPSTINKGEDYTWHDLADSATTMPISFAVVIYGKAGDNVDVIREAIVRDILAVSRYDRSAWAKVLPELFSPNEMVFIPFWEAVLDAYDPLNDDIYRSTFFPDEITNLAVHYTPNFSPSHIRSFHNAVPTLFRGIVMAATPHEPLDDKESPAFCVMYPDYILTDSLSPDFHRMSEKTRAMVNNINYLLRYAEEYNDYYVLPAGFSRTVRSNFEFITLNFDGYLYHALTKRSFGAEPATPQ